MRFTKMQGIGNDYIYVDTTLETVADPASLARAMSQPHFGVGSDGLVLIEASDVADFAMRIFNADGSEAEMCGNAIRCTGKYVYDRGLTDKTQVTIMTKAGLRVLDLHVKNGQVESVTVDMGSPELNPRLVPVDMPGEAVINHRMQMGGRSYQISCVSMGNPHCVVFVDDPELVDLPNLGPMFENHPLFPNRTNTEFLAIPSRKRLEMRVWERGAGETLACGTGACACVVAAVLSGRADREVTVKLKGGELQVVWDAQDNHLYQTGPAAFVFDGEWPEA
ncbi:MAG: diaminopimelate epimerase [Clostridia bacterium]|nr:diaminopimelate epimerase [Clostridia bacterium]